MHFKYSVKPSDHKSFTYMVEVKTDDGHRHVLCYIPTYFNNDKGIAEAIIKSLENSKYIPDITI